ncbi:MAG: DUF6174 domain-containing protein [Lutibacter sp.]|nr:DUF6174 domain-containing protein [Lutibacter sp.]
MKKILLLLISLILISCSDSDNSDEFTGLNFDQNAFEKNRQLWTDNEISNYTFSQEYFSSSVGPQPKLTSIVINRELDAIFVQSTNETNISLEELTYYETIDNVYDFINYIVNSCEEQINSNQSPMEGAKIEITYDDTFHYPTKIICSGYYSNVMLGGLNIQIIISDFEVNQ